MGTEDGRWFPDMASLAAPQPARMISFSQMMVFFPTVLNALSAVTHSDVQLE